MFTIDAILTLNGLFFTGILSASYCSSAEGSYIPRDSWGARAPSAPREQLSVKPPPFVIIHHSETPTCSSRNSCNARVKSIQNYHMDTNHWDDIGYNFLIAASGDVYEGRGWGVKGAHAPAYNAKSIGICFIGAFSHASPSAAAINAAQGLIANGVSTANIANNYTLLGHRQTKKTDCPGDTLYGLIKTWPNWRDI